MSLYYRFIPTHVGQMRSTLLESALAERFIPTHVGQIGERCNFGERCSGSSPRMWGRCATAAAATRLNRFIPTHVGQIYVRRKRSGY